MPKLVQAVSSCRTFRKKPIGPLGAHVNMVEGCSEQLSRAVEGELGGVLNAFLCDNRCCTALQCSAVQCSAVQCTAIYTVFHCTALFNVPLKCAAELRSRENWLKQYMGEICQSAFCA